MGYIIGIDGGGTKTAFALGTTQGETLCQVRLESISLREHGRERVKERIQGGVRALEEESGIGLDQVCHVALGAPGCGESRDTDRTLREVMEECFPDTPWTLVNDGAVGYYGALSGRPGINLVAGTGAIAFGADGNGNIVRSGGWSEHFSDEGSCYWLGKLAMGLFCKESDGREPRGALYRIVREQWSLENDFDFIEVMEREYLPFRSKVARLQVLLLQAASAGDEAAKALYVQAAGELCQMAVGIARQLELPRGAEVSLTGGLSHAGELVTGPLTRMLAEHGFRYTPAEASPVEGALILARQKAMK